MTEEEYKCELCGKIFDIEEQYRLHDCDEDNDEDTEDWLE